MRIAEVIGRVTLSRSHPQLEGGRLLDRAADAAGGPDRRLAGRGEEVVVYDNLGAGPGSLIGLSEGREAANPFGKTKTPVDAYCACLIDQLAMSESADARPRSEGQSGIRSNHDRKIARKP